MVAYIARLSFAITSACTVHAFASVCGKQRSLANTAPMTVGKPNGLGGTQGGCLPQAQQLRSVFSNSE